MNDKPEALRLADDLDELVKAAMLDKSGNTARTAAELRRLYAENEMLKTEPAEREARLNGMGSEREARLLAVNAELVEALQDMYDEQTGPPLIRRESQWQAAMSAARAALAKAGEGR